MSARATRSGGDVRASGAGRAEAALWTALDSVDGPQYHREEVTVRIGDAGEVVAFVYGYRGPLRGVPIPGGDYRAHAPDVSIHHDPRA